MLLCFNPLKRKAEAHLERVSRLEAELLVLRSGAVPAETKAPATAPTSPPRDSTVLAPQSPPPSIVPSASVEPTAPTSPLATSPPGSVPQAVVPIASLLRPLDLPPLFRLLRRGGIPRSLLTFRSWLRISRKKDLLFCGAAAATVSAYGTFTAAATDTRTH
jgi:hypothetical protein